MKTRTIYRSSITGKIVTKKYAKENPDTTQKETVQICNLKDELTSFLLHLNSNITASEAHKQVEEYLNK